MVFTNTMVFTRYSCFKSNCTAPSSATMHTRNIEQPSSFLRVSAEPFATPSVWGCFVSKPDRHTKTIYSYQDNMFLVFLQSLRICFWKSCLRSDETDMCLKLMWVVRYFPSAPGARRWPWHPSGMKNPQIFNSSWAGSNWDVRLDIYPFCV